MADEHAVTGIMVVAPSTVGVNEPFHVGVKMLTAPYSVGTSSTPPCTPSLLGPFNASPRGIEYLDNVPPDWRGAVDVEGGEGYDGPASFSFAEGSGPLFEDPRPIRRFGPVRFTSPGAHFLTLTTPQSGVTRRSNPIIVTRDAPDERLYWGDLHLQTYFSDGLRSPEALYCFARDEAFLDICALSDHTKSLTDRQWDYFAAVTNDFNEPGRFVTLVGQEWTSKTWGHRNVYFPGDKGPILRRDDPVHGELPKVYEVAREHGALVIPHHSARADVELDWSIGHDSEVERLVEVYSVWGNSERPEQDGNPRPIRVYKGEKQGQHVVDALRLGRRFGFTGGGDIHDGRPGDELHHFQERPREYRLLRRQGITGVWAGALTREAIFEALWNRRVYATSNVRILLRFSIDGHPMGSEITSEGDPTFRVAAYSEVPIGRVDIVKDGEHLITLRPAAQKFEWEGEDRLTRPTSWYYVRVTREDGEMAWSSPIWVSR